MMLPACLCDHVVNISWAGELFAIDLAPIGASIFWPMIR